MDGFDDVDRGDAFALGESVGDAAGVALGMVGIVAGRCLAPLSLPLPPSMTREMALFRPSMTFRADRCQHLGPTRRAIDAIGSLFVCEGLSGHRFNGMRQPRCSLEGNHAFVRACRQIWCGAEEDDGRGLLLSLSLSHLAQSTIVYTPYSTHLGSFRPRDPLRSFRSAHDLRAELYLLEPLAHVRQ